MRIAIFLGPTMPAAEAARALDAVYLPPARQGDFYRLVRDHRPRIIGLVDGYFHQAPAVWHREILFALSEGVHVFGAASMGALRAAELHPFGMRGVGAIFEAYRKGAYAPYPAPFERDDEVAIEHGPAETDYLAVTDALVDMRATFAEATRRGILSATACLRLAALAAHMHFTQRTYDAVLQAAVAERVDGLDAPRFEAWLRSNKLSQKARDAGRMLSEIAAFDASKPGAFQPNFHFERALVWERFRARCDEEAEASLTAIEAQILDELRLTPDFFAKVSDEARLHWAAFHAPASDRREATASDARAGLLRIRARHALPRRADLDEWMRGNAVDEAAMRRLVVREADLERLPAAPPRALLDHARAAGLVASLRARALDKRNELAGVAEAQRSPESLEGAAAARWWFMKALGEDIPDDLGRRVLSLGFESEQAFHAAVWKERLYLARKEANN